MKKRLLSILLAAVLTLTMLPVTAMATASNDYTQWRQGDPEWNQAEAWPADQYPNASMRWMRNAGCLVTSVAMLLRHYGVVTTTDVNSFNPWICNNALKAAGAFTSGADMYWDGVRKAYPGFVYVGQKSYSKETLASLYSQGYACIVGVNGNGHYVAVKSANSSGATIMDPGWGYTSLSSFSSVNTIVYYSATPSAHTCDRGSYQYYEAAHPHYKNYKCSICGEIWRDTSEPTKVSSCEQCYPRTAYITYYDADGFVWGTASVTANESYTLASDYPTKSGSYFVGWAYTPETDDFDLRPDDTVTMKGDTDLYPVYVTHERIVSGETVYIYDISDFDSAGYDVSSAQYTVSTRVDDSDWGSWSDYSFSSASASDTTQVETETLYRYYYYLCPSCGAHEPFIGTSDCGAQIPSSAWHDYWSTVPYSKSNRQTFSYTSSKYYTTSLGDGQLWCFSAGNLYDTAPGTIDSGSDAVVIETGYRTRRWQTKYEAVERTVTGYQVTESAIPTSGSCGENLTWYFDESTSTLMINGTGAMANYGERYYQIGDIPWWKIKSLIENIRIGNGVTSIGDNAFYMLENLSTVTISGTVTSIGEYAFAGSGLYAISIPYGVTSIGAGAFSRCDYLHKIEIPGSVAELPWNMLKDCPYLTDVVIYNGVTTIGYDVFRGCSSLKSVTIPATVHSIGGHAFMDCEALTDIYYNGSASQWSAITVGADNEPLTSATLHCVPTAPVVKIGNSSTSGKPQLTWNAVEGATSYRIYRSTSKGSGYSLLGTTTATSYTNTGAKAGTTYYYRVKAVNDAGLSPYSNIVSGQVKTVTPKPAAPVVKIGKSAASGKPMLTWNAVSGATSYKVYRATSRSGTYSLLGTVTATSYTNTGAKAGTTYYYKVKAVNSAGESAYSNIVSGQATVTTLTLGHSSASGKPQLTWKTVSGAASYKVYRATSKTGAYSVINTTSALTYTNTGAALGTTYYYKVEALNASGKSMGFSAIVEGKVAPVLAVGYSSVSGKPQLTWKAVPGATEYQVYRSTQQNSGYAKINTTTATSYVNTGAKAGTTYYYKIVAVKGTAVSDFSNIVTARPGK